MNRMGADVLRLVYAFLDYTTEIALGDTIYTSVSEAYRKIRNTFRYMLGNLYDFDPARDLVAPAGDDRVRPLHHGADGAAQDEGERGV